MTLQRPYAADMINDHRVLQRAHKDDLLRLFRGTGARADVPSLLGSVTFAGVVRGLIHENCAVARCNTDPRQVHYGRIGPAVVGRIARMVMFSCRIVGACIKTANHGPSWSVACVGR